ncbi:MAG: ABC transporter permease, partial [Longimicrobiales bacterium]
LVLIHSRFGDMELSSNSLPNFRDVASSARTLSWLAAAHDASPALTDRSGEPERVSALYVTWNYLPGLGARVDAGRPFDRGDYATGAERVAIVSSALARRRWGSAASAVGASVRLDGDEHRLIGVMATSFRDPEPIESGAITGIWLPAREGDGAFAHRDAYWFRLIARVAPGATPDAARRELAAAGRHLAAAYPSANTVDADSLDFVLRSLHESTVGDARQRLLLLLGAVALLLVLSCANVASLFLTRGVARTSELAVRSALGATRARLTAQLFAESLLTAIVSGIVGGLMGFIGLRIFVAAAPAGIPRLHEVSVDVRVLLFVVALTVLTAIVFGTLPALRGARNAAAAAAGLRATTSRPAQRLQSALVAAEIAIALVLVTGSALLLNSFAHLLRIEPGFDGDDVIVVDLRPPFSATTDTAELAFHRLLLQRASALPGVSHASMAYTVPGLSGGAWTRVSVEGGGADARARRTTAPAVGASPGDGFFRFNAVHGELFETLDIPLRAGRALAGDEDSGDPLVIVLNEAAVRRLFPDDDRPIGRRLAFGPPGSDAPMREVIGIVGDVLEHGPGSDAEPQIYVPYGQRLMDRLNVVLERNPGAAITPAAIRRTVREVAPAVPVDRIESLRAHYAATGEEARFLTFLLSVLAGIGLVLAAIGTFATASHAVSRNVREVGIRLALGARSGTVFRLVVARTLRIAGAGIAAGLALALALARFLEGYVFGITTRDPLSVGVAMLVIGGCAALAAMGPALRAARVDPNDVLRGE